MLLDAAASWERELYAWLEKCSISNMLLSAGVTRFGRRWSASTRSTHWAPGLGLERGGCGQRQRCLAAWGWSGCGWLEF